MPIDFMQLDPSQIIVRILNAYQPDPDGAIFASYMIEDQDQEDSYLYLLAIDPASPVDHRVLFEGFVMPQDHVTLARDRHFVLEIPNVVRIVGAEGLIDSVGSESEADMMRIWGGGLDHVYLTGSKLEIERLSGEDLLTVTSGDVGLMRAMQVFDDGTFLACGDYGTILAGGPDGVTHDPFGLPTTDILRSILRAADGTVYVGCDDGAAYIIRNGELITLDPADSHLVALCEFQGQVYWGAADGVMIEKDGALEVFCPIADVYALNATAHSMVAVTEEAAFVFDGARWRGFAMLFDQGPETQEFDVSALNP